MSAPSTERRLAAIMFTDIVGYTALMAESEEQGPAGCSCNQERIQLLGLTNRCHGLGLYREGDVA